MPKTVRCPNCGYEFEEGLEDKGLTYTEAKEQVEGLLEGGQLVDIGVVSKQYGRPRQEVTDMIAKIRKKRPDKILRTRKQGQFKFMSELEEISSVADKTWRHITGELRAYARDKSVQLTLLEKTNEPEKLELAAEMRGTFHIVGGSLPEPVKAKRLPSGLFQIASADGTKEQQEGS